MLLTLCETRLFDEARVSCGLLGDMPRGADTFGKCIIPPMIVLARTAVLLFNSYCHAELYPGFAEIS